MYGVTETDIERRTQAEAAKGYMRDVVRPAFMRAVNDWLDKPKPDAWECAYSHERLIALRDILREHNGYLGDADRLGELSYD